VDTGSPEENAHMKAIQLRITGLVQGVGYRAWFADEARARGLVGWVRNRTDGSVEACIAGDESVLEQMIEAARSGPGRVDHIETVETDAKGLDGLRILPTL
jgi:acylphosphatase